MLGGVLNNYDEEERYEGESKDETNNKGIASINL